MTGDPRHPALDFPELAAALAGQYELERELGRGGMGVVFLARDVKLDRRVAIKTLLPHLTADERVRDRFIREARTAAGLTHPGIVPIHRADEVNGQVFFVMGFVEGESLAQRIRENGPLPAGEVLPYLRDVAQALGAAHERGIIHRDVKAENILIERRGRRAVVTDFGIARLAEASPLTATGLVLGTVYYMSPEQVAGEPVDDRSDIYSLGVVAFLALSGCFPFDSETASAVLVAHVTKPAPRLGTIAPDVPSPLARIVDRCLAKDPAERYPSCAALADAFTEVAASIGPVPVRQEVAPPVKRRRDALVSETEAQAVWQRAAQLQAQPDAAPQSPAPGEHHRAASRSSAYSVETVRDSAREAGIPTGFVDRALIEHGLAEATGGADSGAHRRGALELYAPPVAGLVRDVAIGERSVWTGERANIEHELVIDEEMPERDFDWLIETIRRTLGDVGVVSTVGRTLSWVSADPQRKVHISVQVRGGRTTIRVGERLTALRGSTFGGIVGGFGGGFGFATMGLLMGTAHLFPLALASAGVIVGTSYGVARLMYGRVVRDRDSILRTLTERLGEDARTSIAERDRSLARTRPGKLPPR